MKVSGGKLALAMLFLFAVSSLSGCEGEVGRKVKRTGVYYDLKGLLDHHLHLLDTLQPTVEKVTEIDGNREAKVVQLDSAGWTKEMQIFYQADINEPVLRDAYAVEEGISEDSLRTITYRALDDKSVQIDYLKVFYRKEEERPVYITALFKENNALYKAERTLKLSFDNSQTPPVLSGYAIEGIQKMLMKDTVFYKVKAKIIF